jgi:hypothetical protein
MQGKSTPRTAVRRSDRNIYRQRMKDEDNSEQEHFCIRNHIEPAVAVTPVPGQTLVSTEFKKVRILNAPLFGKLLYGS